MTHATRKKIRNIQDLIGHNNRESKFNRCKIFVNFTTKIDEIIVWIKEFIMRIVFMDV